MLLIADDLTIPMEDAHRVMVASSVFGQALHMDDDDDEELDMIDRANVAAARAEAKRIEVSLERPTI